MFAIQRPFLRQHFQRWLRFDLRLLLLLHRLRHVEWRQGLLYLLPRQHVPTDVGQPVPK